MIKKFLYWLANNNFGYYTSRYIEEDIREFKPIWVIRKLQCDVFGHDHFGYTKDNGWCSWCARIAGKYPKMRERLPENKQTILEFKKNREIKRKLQLLAETDDDCKSGSDNCNGSKVCENRKFDANKKDCQECLKDYSEAMQQAQDDFEIISADEIFHLIRQWCESDQRAMLIAVEITNVIKEREREQ